MRVVHGWAKGAQYMTKDKKTCYKVGDDGEVYVKEFNTPWTSLGHCVTSLEAALRNGLLFQKHKDSPVVVTHQRTVVWNGMDVVVPYLEHTFWLASDKDGSVRFHHFRPSIVQPNGEFFITNGVKGTKLFTVEWPGEQDWRGSLVKYGVKDSLNNPIQELTNNYWLKDL